MKKILLLFTFIFYITLVSAYNFRQISSKNGLSNSAILSIYQDDNGYMWFGSCDGLNVFNGSDISVYKSPDDKNNLSGNLIEDIIETENDIFWLQTNYGLNRLDNKKKSVTYFPYFTGYVLLEKDKHNNLFIIRDDGCIYYYSKQIGTIDKISVPEIVVADIADYTIDENDVLWLFFKSGNMMAFSILNTTAGKMELSLLQSKQHSEPIIFCSHENNTVYFIDASHTLFEYDLIQHKKEYILNIHDEISRKGEISSIIKQKNDFYIGFKTNGLIRMVNTADRKEKFEIEEIDIQSGIFCLYKDRNQDIIWVGTDGQGVFLLYEAEYSIRPVTFHNIPNNIEKPVRALFMDKERNLWIGTKGDGILRLLNFDNNKNITDTDIEYFNTDNSGLGNNSVYAFAASGKNILWIGHDEGINYYSYKEKRVKNIHLECNGQPLKYIHSIQEANDSTLWLASVGMGIIQARIEGTPDKPVLKDIKQFAIHDGKTGFNHFFTIYVENESNIWFGNRGYGAFRMNPATYQLNSIQFDKALNNQLLNDVFSITKDDEDNLWCGTSLGLVKYVPDGTITVFNESSGFPNNTVHGILKDSKSNFWLSTNGGIVRFDIKSETFQAFNNNNGLNVTEFSDGAFFKDETTNQLYFGGINGFVIINDTSEKPRQYTPPIHFNSLSIFGDEYNIYDFYSERNDQPVLQLDYNQNFFSISFSANDYINGNNYSYYYKLKGVNDQWIDNKDAKSISFTNIAPGTYSLYVKYINRVTGEESETYPLTLSILPPWYLSTIAYIIYIVLIFLSVIFFSYYFVKKGRKKRKEVLEKMRQKHQEEVHESKLRFFTNIAHEFCTPLTLIYGPCNRILAHEGADQYVQEYAQLIQRNAERLNGLILELIEFRRIETGNRTPQIESLSITDLTYDIIDSFSESIETKNFHFENNIQDELYWNSDKTFLYTVITNLLSNALKYTDKNGTISISVKADENILSITISNTGKGIKKEDFDNVFNRYSVLDNFENQDESTAVSRNGLGLAISNNLVRLLDGEISFESIPDELTSFIIKLPKKAISLTTKTTPISPEISLAKEYNKQIIKLPDYGYDKNKLTVFVIDDDIEILWLICELLSETYNVIPWDKVTGADELFKDVYPDIIICDVMMPGINGIVLTRQIKANKKTSHIPMILLSAKHGVEEQIEGISAGAEMYITKPFNIDYLKISVQRLILRKETLKDYFASSISAFDMIEGKLTHVDDKNFLQKVVDIINNNLTKEDLSAQLIADKLGLSVRHLYRKTNDICHKSINEIIKECRLHVAQNFLLNSKMTIDEVMINSGFANRTTFYRIFSEKYKCTPKEYREKNFLD